MGLKRLGGAAAVVGIATVGLIASPAGAATPVTTIGIDKPTVYLNSSTVVSVYGTVTPAAPGHVVYLQSLTGGSWLSIASTKLTYKSHYAFAVRPTGIATYTLRTYDPPTANGQLANVSRSVTLQTLRPAIHISVDHAVLPYYKNPYVSGTVSPTSHNHVVYLQSQNADGTWTSITSRHLDANGAFSIGLSPGYLKTYSFRLYDPPTADGYHAAVSAVVHFTSVDPEPPSVSVASPGDGASYPAGSVPKAVFSCTAGTYSSILPGLDGCSATIDGQYAVVSGGTLATDLGAHSVVVMATQMGGKQTSVTLHYTVVT